MASSAIKLAVIGGDGIGPEVVSEALKVLQAANVGIDATTYDLGAQRWHRTGETLPDSVLEEIRAQDAILLGAVGDPTVPSGVLERGLLLRPPLRASTSTSTCARSGSTWACSRRWRASGPNQSTCWSSGKAPRAPYAGAGGVLRKGTPEEVATQESLNTAFGVRRVVRYAFERAAERPAQRLTLVHKTNVLAYAGDLWQRTVEALAKEFSTIAVDYCHVDAASMFFVSQPDRFDVLVPRQPLR